MGHKHVRVAVDDLPWEPWDLYFKGAPPNPESGEYGGWCKVLRRPEGEDTHWTFLLKLVPPAGKKIRFVAIAGSNEEGYLLSGSSITGEDWILSLEGLGSLSPGSDRVIEHPLHGVAERCVAGVLAESGSNRVYHSA